MRDLAAELGPAAVVALPSAGSPGDAAAVELLPFVDAGDFEGEPLKDREWMTAQFEPRGSATLLTGAGATGKSLLAQQRMTCSAAGISFLGVETAPGISIYVSCEDPLDELHRRQHAINEAICTTWAAIRGRLYLISLKGGLENELCRFDASGRMTTTTRWRELVATVQALGATHVALDNCAHFFAGDENDRHQVAAFIGLLDRLAQEIAGGVLFIGHPNKRGDEFSGSTAWENQVRARLFLGLPEPGPDGIEDPDARLLTNSKPNYARRGEAIEMRWHRWAFVRPSDIPDDLRAEMASVAADNTHNDRFLTCLAERTRQARAVSERLSSTYAPAVFAGMPEARGSTKKDLERAMDRLFRSGRIERAELWRGADRKPVFGLRETAGDRNAEPQKMAEMRAGDGAGDGAGDMQATELPLCGEPAGDRGQHTPPLLRKGARAPSRQAARAPNGSGGKK